MGLTHVAPTLLTTCSARGKTLQTLEAWPTWLGDKESVQVGEVGEESSQSWPVVVLPD
jgi:hypothetical protein